MEGRAQMDNSDARDLEVGSEGDNRWAIILAGGDGTRLYPLTRMLGLGNRPKQFCPFLDGETLLERTQRRVSLCVAPEQTLLVLTRSHERFYHSLLSGSAAEKLVIQPSNKGTAPAILYSLLKLARRAPSALVAFFPSDHYFSEDRAFIAQVEAAYEAARTCGAVILLGIRPEAPEIQYGWIEPGEPVTAAAPLGLRRVRGFWEKPSHGRASELMRQGCLWNSFVMIGRVKKFIDMIRRSTPELFAAFARMERHLDSLEEEGQVGLLYSEIPPVNFSEQVLSRWPTDIAVMSVEGVKWSDWGEPSRVLSDLARIGGQNGKKGSVRKQMKEGFYDHEGGLPEKIGGIAESREGQNRRVESQGR